MMMKMVIVQTTVYVVHIMNIVYCCSAGHETVAGAISSCLCLLAKHPEVQQKCQEEIDRVMGDKVDPTYEQVREMYTSFYYSHDPHDTHMSISRSKRWSLCMPL